MKVSIMCPACSGQIVVGDKFCESCGAAVTDEQRAALRERLERSSGDMAAHMKHVREARQTIILLAVMFVLGGVVMYLLARGQAEAALANLREMDPEMIFPQPIGGESMTVARLRDLIESEPRQLLLVNLFLSALMAGLWFWAKKSLLPAILVALAVFVTVHVASAIIDPKTIVQGVIIKIVALVALTRGVKAALAARRLEADHRSLA
ncbi:hypothetical protein [Sorangium sp. So ce1078]|uniref:hypothetical protein n=1 Tax=Sorangium sp. So ce1078 TaxID=3133329 RepID=UPI003F62D21A